MTSNERITALLAGRTPDRLCWLPELNDRFITKVVEQRGPVPEGLDAQTFVNQVIGADQLARAVAVRTRYRQVRVERDSGTTTYITPQGRLVERVEHNETADTNYKVQHLVSGEECFEAYKALIEDVEYLPAYDSARQAIEKVGQTGLVTIDAPATPYMHLLLWDMGIEPTIMGLFDYPRRMVELMDLMHERNKEYYRIAAAGPGRVVRPMEDTSSMLSSPDVYAQHSIGCLKDYAEICHEHGKLFIVHMCGHLRDMLEVIAEVPLDGIEAITPLPTGDADLLAMRRRLGDIWLVGGVDPTTYAMVSTDQMRATVGQVIEQMRGDRHFIVGHEEIPVSAHLENVLAVGELIEQTRGTFYN